MVVSGGLEYGCKHLYRDVIGHIDVSRLYTILQHCTVNCTPIVVCIGVVIKGLQGHFTLFYTFYIVNVKTGGVGCKSVFTFFYFYNNIICTILYIYYIQRA
jgi:hypothetical protein